MSVVSRSLVSYTNSSFKSGIGDISGKIIPATVATISTGFGAITAQYNNQYNDIINLLTARRTELAQTVQNNLLQNSSYTGARNAGVKLAWQYEEADIRMGGTGSANWTTDEQQQIMYSKTGTVSGVEGHHQKNVVDHPEYQADPDNIKFYKSKQEHLQQGHGGNFQNESDAPLINKNEMLEHTNNRRVLQNEIKGAGISAAIGFGVALSISAIVELATLGFEAVNVEKLIVNSIRAGIEGGTISAMAYCAGRVVSGFLQEHGIDVLTKMGALTNYVAVGCVSIVLVSTIQFIKMKINGIGTSEAFKEIGKNALFSTSLLAVSIIAQGVYGGCAGLIVSTSVGLVVLTMNVVSSAYHREISNRVREYAIEEYKPILIER